MKRDVLISTALSRPTHRCYNKHYQLSQCILLTFITVPSRILQEEGIGPENQDIATASSVLQNFVNCPSGVVKKIFILIINQLDGTKFCFTISLFHASTCFQHHVLIIRRSRLYYTAFGIITL